jgi:hypothetical protein
VLIDRTDTLHDKWHIFISIYICYKFLSMNEHNYIFIYIYIYIFASDILLSMYDIDIILHTRHISINGCSRH